MPPSFSVWRVQWDVRTSGAFLLANPFPKRRVRETVQRVRDLQDPEDERPPSLARGEGSREAPGAEGREAAWSSRLRGPQEELAALPGKLHGEEQEKEHLLLQLHGQPSPFLCSNMKQKQYDYTNPSKRKLSLKLVQRLGLILLRVREASWRYQRGSRGLAATLAPVEEQAKEGQGVEEEEY